MPQCLIAHAVFVEDLEAQFQTPTWWLDPTSCSGLYGHWTHTVHRQRSNQNTHKHKIKRFKNKCIHKNTKYLEIKWNHIKCSAKQTTGISMGNTHVITALRRWRQTGQECNSILSYTRPVWDTWEPLSKEGAWRDGGGKTGRYLGLLVLQPSLISPPQV